MCRTGMSDLSHHRFINPLIISTVAVFLIISVLSRSTEANNLLLFLALAGIAQLMSVLVFLYAKKCLQEVSAGKVMCVGFMVTAIGLLGQPVFEDDYFRYLWDAYVFYSKGTPYGVAQETFL